MLARKTDHLDHLVSHYHVRLRTHQKHQNVGQNKKVKINENIWRCREAARVHTGLDVTLRGPVIYTLWKLNLTSLLTVTGHSAWVGRANESIVFCLFSCPQSHSLLGHLPLPPYTLNKGTLNLSRELHIWVNVSVYHFHTVNYFVREIYCYPRMFGLGAPVHLEINKLLLEIPFVSQSGAQRPLLGVSIHGDMHA